MSSLREAGAITGVGETKYLRGTDRTAPVVPARGVAQRDPGRRPGAHRYRWADPVRARRRGRGFHHQFRHQGSALFCNDPMGGASAVASIQCALAVIDAGICNHVLLSLGRHRLLGRADRYARAANAAVQTDRPNSRCRSVPLRRRNFMPQWPAGTWSCTAPPRANWPKSPSPRANTPSCSPMRPCNAP